MFAQQKNEIMEKYEKIEHFKIPFFSFRFKKNPYMESLIKSIDDDLTVLKFQRTYLTHFSAKKQSSKLKNKNVQKMSRTLQEIFKFSERLNTAVLTMFLVDISHFVQNTSLSKEYYVHFIIQNAKKQIFDNDISFHS